MLGLLSKLKPREKTQLSVASVVVFVMLVWAWGIQPLQESIALEEDRIQEYVKDLHWLQTSVQKAKSLNKKSTKSFKNRGGLSIIALVDQSARLQGMDSGIRKVEPSGDVGVRIWLEKVHFNALVHWIERLQREYGLVVIDIQVDQDRLPGTVKAQVTFKDMSQP